MGWVKDLKMKKKIHEGFHKRKHKMSLRKHKIESKTSQARSKCETARVRVSHWRIEKILIKVALDS